ncbi:cation:proton antiporter [Reyranella sp.]|uniref:cation:proton antiporter domain-containing protein n=1 Tax=Reyranella sp. TaxID=1929291 RepID=UPI002F91C50A
MAGLHEVYAFKDALIVLGTAAVVAPIMPRLRVSPVLGYLAVGALLGPYGLGRLAESSRLLDWLTVTGERQIDFIGNLGIVFLLFFIGLELSLRRLLTLRRLVFGLGGLQIVLTTAAISMIALGRGQPPAASLVIGACLALSSTAIVMELLSGQRRMMSTTGRTSFAILLAQDLAVVPLLLLIGALGGRDTGSVWLSVAIALGEAMLAVAAIALVGRLVLRPLFRLAAGSDNPEFFMAATLLVTVSSGVVAAFAGLSMALGAFIAGLLLAETEYRRAVETTIDPFRGLLLGVFFFSVGMHIDLGVVWHQPLLVAAGVLAMLLLKGSIIAPLCRLFGLPWGASVEIGLLLGPGGEFAFIGIGLAAILRLVAADVAAGTLAVVSLTMALLPLIGVAGRHLSRRMEAKAKGMANAVPPPDDHLKRVIVVGHGRVGQLVCGLLDEHAIPYLATDRDAKLVERWRERGRPIYYGDASDPHYLRRCGLDEAVGVIVTLDTQVVDDVVRAVRARRPDVMIVARAHDAQHALHLYTLRVTDAVPETIEASLLLAESALVGLGVPMGAVIASIHERREQIRNELQAAAGGPASLRARLRRARRDRSSRA